MRYSTWEYKKEKMRTRLGYHAYHMRRWLRLFWRSWLLSSYSLPMSMLTPEGIDHNSRDISLQKVNMTIKWKLEQRLENEKHLWILEKLEIALMKTENQDISTTMYMNIWWENAGNQRRKKRQRNTTNMTK